MTNICLKLAYDGSSFCGFARQPGMLTVQGELESALSTIYRDNITTTCAGRTDAGVHARAQVVNFQIPENLEKNNFEITGSETYERKPFASVGQQKAGSTNFGTTSHEEDSFNSSNKTGLIANSVSYKHACKKASSTNLGTTSSEVAKRYSSPDTGSLLRSVNALTHENISVYDAKHVSDDFSARFSAKSRTYKYFIYNNPTPPIFSKNFSWHISKTLKVEKMKEASSYFIGEKDFKSFCLSASSIGKTTIREVIAITFSTERFFDEELLAITIIGNAFLHSMVRAIVGSLVLIGKGMREAEWIKGVLEARNRSSAGENAPAKGLVLWDVAY